VFLGLLDEGRVTSPGGSSVEAPGAIVALSSNLGTEDLAYRLRDAPFGRNGEQLVCREHLRREGWPPELIGRIGCFAVFEPLDRVALRDIGKDAIQSFAREYGLELEALPPVIADVVLDLADASEIGARALAYAARDLLMNAFAAAARDGLSGPVSLEAGPPPRVVAETAALS
jgi:ATP-dependent Clp protease ATP-binding subunit ClpA